VAHPPARPRCGEPLRGDLLAGQRQHSNIVVRWWKEATHDPASAPVTLPEDAISCQELSCCFDIATWLTNLRLYCVFSCTFQSPGRTLLQPALLTAPWILLRCDMLCAAGAGLPCAAGGPHHAAVPGRALVR
jgi:hypothetical protein